MAAKRKPITQRVQKFDKSVDTGPQNYEYMSKLQGNLVQDARIKRQQKAQAKQK